MRELTPEEQEAVRHAVNDMRIEGFRITEQRALALARAALAQKPPRQRAGTAALIESVRRRARVSA
jgi:hypothetical protein